MHGTMATWSGSSTQAWRPHGAAVAGTRQSEVVGFVIVLSLRGGGTGQIGGKLPPPHFYFVLVRTGGSRVDSVVLRVHSGAQFLIHSFDLNSHEQRPVRGPPPLHPMLGREAGSWHGFWWWHGDECGIVCT